MTGEILPLSRAEMMSDRHPLRVWASRLSSLLVLAALGGAAYLGHKHHWKVPSFAALVGTAEPAKEDTAEKGPPEEKTGSTDPEHSPVRFDSPEAVGQAGIECAAAVERPLDVFVRANAVVVYNQARVAELSPRVPGLVWSVLVQPGQAVRKGDVLAVIDAQEVGQAKADLLQEVASAAYKARYLERIRAAAAKGAVAEQALQEAEAAAREAEIRRFNAQQRLLNLGFDLGTDDLANADPRDLARRLHLLGLPESVTRGTDPPPKTANLIPLKAPFDGVITRQDMVIGERATPDRSELTMADVRTMWVRLSVRKEDADRLALGQPVRFTSDAAPHVAEGKLAWISTAVDEKTRTVQARAVVKNPLAATAPPGDVENPRLLRANEYGTARVRVAHLDRAVLVPDKAIQRLMDRTPLVFVALPDGRTFEPRKVELGESRDGFTHVRSGVRAGERVATANSYVLKSELMKDTLVAGD